MITLEKFNELEKALPRQQFEAILSGDQGEIMLLESSKNWSQYGAVKPRHNGKGSDALSIVIPAHVVGKKNL
jgi:hypothetical protein